jgi:hypothetical protein
MVIDKQIETAVSTLYYKEEILFIEFKKNAVVELSHINEIINERAEIQEGQKVRTLVDIRNLWQADKDARSKAATPAMTDHNIALAILSNSLPTRIIGNFYMKFNKPNVPTKMFDSESEAIEWLRTFH